MINHSSFITHHSPSIFHLPSWKSPRPHAQTSPQTAHSALPARTQRFISPIPSGSHSKSPLLASPASAPPPSIPLAPIRRSAAALDPPFGRTATHPREACSQSLGTPSTMHALPLTIHPSPFTFYHLTFTIPTLPRRRTSPYSPLHRPPSRDSPHSHSPFDAATSLIIATPSHHTWLHTTPHATTHHTTSHHTPHTRRESTGSYIDLPLLLVIAPRSHRSRVLRPFTGNNRTSSSTSSFHTTHSPPDPPYHPPPATLTRHSPSHPASPHRPSLSTSPLSYIFLKWLPISIQCHGPGHQSHFSPHLDSSSRIWHPVHFLHTLPPLASPPPDPFPWTPSNPAFRIPSASLPSSFAGRLSRTGIRIGPLRPLQAGCRMRMPGRRIMLHDTRHTAQDTGHRPRDTGHRIRDRGREPQGTGRRTEDRGQRTRGRGHGTNGRGTQAAAAQSALAGEMRSPRGEGERRSGATPIP
jgi:hypothetical protein